MRIERVNVEIILEWLERYSNIFRGPITRCVNNYEAGAWEALEAMKEEVSYMQFIRIIESLQAAVEKIPITDAFDELDSERDYYQEKRKESNERLIKRKGMIGKAIRICSYGMYVCWLFDYSISIYWINKYVNIIPIYDSNDQINKEENFYGKCIKSFNYGRKCFDCFTSNWRFVTYV